MVAATFALELIQPFMAGALDVKDQWLGARAIEDACRLLRAAPPMRAERVWHLAAVALIQRAHDDYFLIGRLDKGVGAQVAAEIRRGHGTAVDQLSHAKERIGDDPQFRLAAATSIEVHEISPWYWLSRPDPALRDVERHAAEDAIKRYQGLAIDPAIRAETLLRSGVLAFRLRDDTAAIERLDRAAASTDEPELKFLGHFVAGKVFERAHRYADAERRYRVALGIVPRAQSAVTSLAALLFLSKRRDEARALLEDAWQDAVRDPWRDYACGGCRHWPALIDQLRRELQASK